MSRSYKREARAQARAVQARRAARKAAHSNFESPDKIFESKPRLNANENDSHSRGKKDPLDASPRSPSRWPAPRRA